MLINSSARLSLVQEAQNEIDQELGAIPLDDFYRTKLTSSWERARSAVAYRELGPFSSEAFQALPVMSKDSLKRAPWDYVVANLDEAAKYYETTGTSGLVTPTPRTVEDIVWNAISVASAWRELIGTGDRVLILLPSDLVPVADLIVSVCEYLEVPHAKAYPFATGITDWDRLVGVFRAFRPTVVFAAPGVVVQFTRLVKQRGLLAELREPVRSLMMLGEVSTDPMRDRIGSWWEARCYDISYGSTETGTLAASCADGSLHMLTATNYFELHTDHGAEPLVLDDDQTRTGNLVVTPLNLYARPLLRLDTGDRVTVGVSCVCGSVQPTVMIHGRGSDGLTLYGVGLTPRVVEEIVYGVTMATGYLIEMDVAGEYGRLLLERDFDVDRVTEADQRAAVRNATAERLGIQWDDIVFVNALAVTTKSGGSQKSWKRSNIRIVEPVA